MEIDHEIFSTVILSLPLIQEGQLSVSDFSMKTRVVGTRGTSNGYSQYIFSRIEVFCGYPIFSGDMCIYHYSKF